MERRRETGVFMGRRTRRARWGTVLGATLLTAFVLAGCSSGPSGPAVLLVGKFHGMAGQYTSIQAAVDAAHPGDFILVAPGDYHEDDDAHVTTAAQLGTGDHGGVVVHTSDLHIVGMDRNTVIVDGTKSGAPGPCSSSPQYQNFGPMADGKAQGRNGIVVWKADDVSIENLTACNFLGGAGDSGNEIWWNGGDGSGKIGLSGYTGTYLTGTSTYFSGESTAAQYGIFSSNSQGPGSWNQIYGSNMNDSGMYVGACHQLCDVTIDHAWMENNALGYSGTNSGGAVVIENSEFDHNEDGVDTNTQIAGDPPPPQNGACPDGAISPITHTHSCWVFIHNDVHDNNNPDVPEAGNAAAGPIGTGMTISGGRNDTVTDNVFENNGAWGTLFVPYPDTRHAVAPPEVPQLRRVRDQRARVRLRGRGRRPDGQHLRQRRLLREPDQRRLRPDRAARRPALQLLRRQRGPGGVDPRQPGGAPAQVRRAFHSHQSRQRAGGPGRVRLRSRGLPGRRHVPGPDRGDAGADAVGPADHAQPVRRRAVEPVVPVGTAGGIARSKRPAG